MVLKVLASHLSGDAEFVQRFQQEVISTANLEHLNVTAFRCHRYQGHIVGGAHRGTAAKRFLDAQSRA